MDDGYGEIEEFNAVKTVYFAHPIAHYDDEIEWTCIEIIMNLLTPNDRDVSDGYIDIMNPNQKWLHNMYVARKEEQCSPGDKEPFEIFREIVRACDMVVGVTFFDGTLGAGVAEEMKVGLESGKEVYLIFFNQGIKFFLPVSNLDNYTILSREETRKRIDKGEM